MPPARDAWKGMGGVWSCVEHAFARDGARVALWRRWYMRAHGRRATTIAPIRSQFLLDGNGGAHAYAR